MRGHTTTELEATPQRVAVRVNLALKDAGYRATGSDLERARYAFAESVTSRAFIVTFKNLSESELRQILNAADEPDTITAFLKVFELERYRRHARRILHGFIVATPAPMNDPQAVLETRIATALKETAYAAAGS